MRQVLIIGAGASGLMAAVMAARNGAKVTLLEHKKQIGKKILVTGNGKCNLTNENQELICYRGNEEDFIKEALSYFGKKESLKFFQELGIYTKEKRGYYYPYCEQAASVVEAFRMELQKLKVKVSCDTNILGIEKVEEKFLIKTEGWTYEADAVILACGSKATSETGSDGSGYEFAESLGHTIIKPLPALVQLKAKESYFEKIAGIRIDAKVSVHVNGTCVIKEQGEVQLTKSGISGIPIFQISRYATKALDLGKKVVVNLDLLPIFTEEKILEMLGNTKELHPQKTMAEALNGLFAKKLIGVLLSQAHIKETKKIEEISEIELRNLVDCIKIFPATIVGSGGFEQAQACSGGVDTREIIANKMESKIVENLYIVGELLDVDGTCGGYNLQWAWTSGYLAGIAAARK